MSVIKAKKNKRVRISRKVSDSHRKLMEEVSNQFGTRVYMMSETVNTRLGPKLIPFVKTTVPRLKNHDIIFLTELIGKLDCNIVAVRSGTSITILIKSIGA